MLFIFTDTPFTYTSQHRTRILSNITVCDDINWHNWLFTPGCNIVSAESHYYSACNCCTFALHPLTNLILPQPNVDNAIEKCRVCICFKEENRPSIISFVSPERPQLILDHCIDMQLASFWHCSSSAVQALEELCLWNKSMRLLSSSQRFQSVVLVFHWSL